MKCMSCYTDRRKVQSYLIEGGVLAVPMVRQLCGECKQIVINFLVREPGSSVKIHNLSKLEDHIATAEIDLDEELLHDDQEFWGNIVNQLLS